MDIAMAYVAFAQNRPSLYEAMFILPSQSAIADTNSTSSCQTNDEQCTRQDVPITV